MQLLATVALQGAKIIDIAELRSQLLEALTVAIARLRPIADGEVMPQVGLNVIVVEQGVVHIEQEDKVIHSAPPMHPVLSGHPRQARRRQRQFYHGMRQE